MRALVVAAALCVASPARAGDDTVTLGTPPAVAVGDQLVVKLETTMTRGKKRTTRRASYTVTVEEVDGGRPRRVAVTHGKTKTSGAWPTKTLLAFDGASFVLHLAEDHRSVLDVHSSKRTEEAVAKAVETSEELPYGQLLDLWLFHRPLVGGMPLEDLLAGKTFAAREHALGASRALYLGLDQASYSEPPRVLFWFEKASKGVARFGGGLRVALVPRKGELALTGDLAGTFTVDTSTARVRSVALEGVLEGDGAKYRVVHRQTFEYRPASP